MSEDEDIIMSKAHGLCPHLVLCAVCGEEKPDASN